MTLSAVFTIAATLLLAPAAVRSDDAMPGPIKSLPWLHEGLQITFYDKFSTTPGVVNGFRDPKDVLLVPAAGKGASQYTVARIEGDSIVLSVRTFLDLSGAPPSLVGESGNMGPATKTLVGVNPWVERETLAMYLKTPAEGIVTFPSKVKVGDKTVDAVSVKSSGPESLTYFVYDASTGLLLNRSSQMLVPGLKATASGGLVNRTDVNIQIRDLVGVRDLKIPWINEPAPQWVGKIKALHYSERTESRTLVNPLHLPPIVMLRNEDITVTARGNGWLQADIQSAPVNPGRFYVPAPKQSTVWGNAQFDGLWAGPAALATLREGQVLDEDPNTGIKTVVAKVDDNFVTITVSNPAGELDYQYDKHSGMAVFTRHFTAKPWVEFTRRLVGTE